MGITWSSTGGICYRPPFSKSWRRNVAEKNKRKGRHYIGKLFLRENEEVVTVRLCSHDRPEEGEEEEETEKETD